MLRVAQVGCGFFGRFQAEAWSRIEGVELVGLCDGDEGRARALADRLGVARVFDDAAVMLRALRPDLLDIATPEASHTALVGTAVEHRTATVCQKPFAGSVAEGMAIVETAERAGVPLLVHENFRFQPWYREARRLMAQGRLGEVQNLTFRLRPGDGQGPRAYLDRQPYFQTMPRLLIHETAIHLIDTFRFLGGEPTGVYACLRRHNPAVRGEDAGIVLLEFPSGALALFDGNRHVDFPADDPRLTMGSFHLEGTGGSLRLDGWGRLWLRPHGGSETEHAFGWTDAGPGGNSVEMLQRHIVRHLENGEPAETSARDYLRNLEIEEAVYRSAETGARIELG